jgi:pimeloyl-ACP methyl ester carboxylesterase
MIFTGVRARRVRAQRGASRLPALVASLIATGLLLSGCQLFPTGPETGPVRAEPEVIGEVPAELEKFYSQEVVWEECEETFACATVQVPMDYANPGGRTLDIAAIRAGASGNAQGTILINPGGPGGSGYNAVLDSLQYLTTDRLRESYNILGFDPRGVGRSSAVECLTDKEWDRYRQDHLDADLSEDQKLKVLTRDARQFSAKCARRSGELLAFIDTASAARDMDILRAVAGDEKLNYLGYSYGTQLGAVYADLFPQNVGRLVLDGAVDPSLDSHELTLGQARAFEEALRAYVADCQTSPDCPLSGDVNNGVETVRKLFRSVERSPMTASDGRVVPVITFFQGFVLPLYDHRNWQALTTALDQALMGDPGGMLQLADFSAERESDGSYRSNGVAAFTAINCLDYPMKADPKTLQRELEELKEASPTFGRYLGYGGLVCEPWPYAPVLEPREIDAAGADPMVVIGTTGDPATPYEWSLALAEQLDSAVHVTWEGEGHTAYGRAGACIEEIVDSYFIDGTVPDDGARC